MLTTIKRNQPPKKQTHEVKKIGSILGKRTRSPQKVINTKSLKKMRQEESQLDVTNAESDEANVEQLSSASIRDNCNDLSNNIEVLMAEYRQNSAYLLSLEV